MTSVTLSTVRGLLSVWYRWIVPYLCRYKKSLFGVILTSLVVSGHVESDSGGMVHGEDYFLHRGNVHPLRLPPYSGHFVLV
ncbi:hypothetical protein Bpfe_019029 [Biomphalaria pfeifferi]|uniref:Uncharacterized protein n=1 Tax=Biomphalaria pfeifferi TaxID=112525 RepID=A0AAD8BDI9_BIOPF|nr:hypothetical protein Bpfe_019029 [Biomphalaria pfeifferi]